MIIPHMRLLQINPNVNNMNYKSIKQNDGTYNILHSIIGLNWEIILIGIRGCNVERMINKLYRDLE